VNKKNIKIIIRKIKNSTKNKNELKYLNKILLNEKIKILFKNIDKEDIINKYQILNINYIYNKLLIFINKYKIIIIFIVIIILYFYKY
jgi:hypothetical protein